MGFPRRYRSHARRRRRRQRRISKFSYSAKRKSALTPINPCKSKPRAALSVRARVRRARPRGLKFVGQLSVVRLGQRPHRRQRAVVEHDRDRVAHLDHHQPHAALHFRRTVVAAAIELAAGAGDGRERAVERAHDLADHDLEGALGEDIAAAATLLGVDEAGGAQFAENGVEEFLRDVIGRGDVGDQGGLPQRHARQMDHRLQPILTLVRQHPRRLSRSEATRRIRSVIRVSLRADASSRRLERFDEGIHTRSGSPRPRPRRLYPGARGSARKRAFA